MAKSSAQAIKRLLRRLPWYEGLRRVYGKIKAPYTNKVVYGGSTTLNVLDTFPAFVAHGWGLYKARAPLTLLSINQTIPALLDLSLCLGNSPLEVKPIDTFLAGTSTSEDEERLRALFNRYGSDKGTTHDYYLAYHRILGDPLRVTKVFEIGLGTNNEDIVSTMGSEGKPGASLRAFRDHCPGAKVYGADFDKRVLFSEDRIETYFVDQTDKETFVPLGQVIGDEFDLMIDDGLHAPNANLHSLTFFLTRLKVGGWAVVEDISPDAEAVWKLVGTIFPSNFECHLLRCKNSLMFLAKRSQK